MDGDYSRLAQVPERSFFLLGVRGVGKSTWARGLAAKRSFDLLDERLYQELLADPGGLSQELHDVGPGDWVILDEVQRVPALLNEVHRLIEGRGIRFALLGSSARRLKTQGTNLLAGRAVRQVMHPLTAFELGADFNLELALTFGTIPIVWAAPDRRATLESYVQLYLKEEIRGEALVRNLPGFVRFLPVAALFHGQTVNAAGIARDTGVARPTVQGYLDILEDTLLTVRVPGYETTIRVRERRQPKLYWIDPGLVRAVRRNLGPVGADERGALFEGWLLHQLRAHNEQSRVFDELHYWSPHGSNVEVDFVLRRDRDLLAIEAKATDRYTTHMLRGLRAISDLGGLTRRILVYSGGRSFRSADGIEVWPHARFAKELASGTLWP